MSSHRRVGARVQVALTAIVLAIVTWWIIREIRPPAVVKPEALANVTDPAVSDAAASPKTKLARPDPTAGATIVGADVCAKCHQDKSDALATSGHAHTFELTAHSAIAKSLDGQTYADTERKFTFHYSFNPQSGLSVRIPGKFDEPFPLQYAVGSGNHGMTFVGIIENPEIKAKMEPLGIEHRVTVYPHAKQRLNLTPGHEDREIRRRFTEFGAPLTTSTLQECVNCHVTSGTFEGLNLRDLRAGVTCENCHGPGSKHIAAAESGDSKPRQLRLLPGTYNAEEQLESCGKCHRGPVPLGTVPRNGVDNIRFQPMSMSQSRCYLESRGQLNCSTCHDPHAGVSHDSAGYIAKCMKCHQAGLGAFSTCPVSPATDCLRCHMPKLKIIREVSFTDHWIRKRDERDAQFSSQTPQPQKQQPQKQQK